MYEVRFSGSSARCLSLYAALIAPVLFVAGALAAEVGEVLWHQKISDTEGGFTRVLDDHDRFGYGVSSPDELNDDGVTDLIVIAHLDDDGDKDIMVVAGAEQERPVRILHNNLIETDGLSFTPVADLADDPDLKLTAAEDLNDDELPDIIAVHAPHGGGFMPDAERGDGSVEVLLNGQGGIQNRCNTYVNDDGLTDIDDLFQVLSAWEPCDHCMNGINDSGVVDIDDSSAILGNWGPCP